MREIKETWSQNFLLGLGDLADLYFFKLHFHQFVKLQGAVSLICAFRGINIFTQGRMGYM